LIGFIQLPVEREEEEERTSRCVWELAVFIAGLLTTAAQQKKVDEGGGHFCAIFQLPTSRAIPSLICLRVCVGRTA
jgi:hypothetical protein